LLEQEQNPKRILAVEMSAIDKLLPGTNNDTNERIEEQRRLFYVAITRCKDSHDGDPGTLIISSFTRLPGNEALQYGISASSYNIKRVTASRFIREFGRTAPSTTIPTR
jgi:superfamily I DNA/RNA helicase